MTNLYFQIQRSNSQRDVSGGVLYGGPRGKGLIKLIMPAQFIVGEDDDIAPPHLLNLASAHIEGFKVIIIADCGHSAYFEKPDLFNFAIEKFIEGSFDYAGQNPDFFFVCI
jgi:pimeloyl-ACP methyl ester carboxylesterase